MSWFAVDRAETCVHAVCVPVSKQLQSPADGGDEPQPCVNASEPTPKEAIMIVRRMDPELLSLPDVCLSCAAGPARG